MSTAASGISDLGGAAALPRRNGELAFDEPWQARAFGLAVHTVDQLGLDWEVFRRHLVRAVLAEPDGSYWERWLTALEGLVADEVDR